MSEDDMDGWKVLTDLIGAKCQLVGDDLFVTNVKRLAEGIKDGLGQLDPDQGQPDRHADRDAGRGRDGAQGRLHRGDVASLGRDRGFDHRRSRGRHQLRTDQDRLAGALGPHREVQSAAADRGGTRHPGQIRRPRRDQGGKTSALRLLRLHTGTATAWSRLLRVRRLLYAETAFPGVEHVDQAVLLRGFDRANMTQSVTEFVAASVERRARRRRAILSISSWIIFFPRTPMRRCCGADA